MAQQSTETSSLSSSESESHQPAVSVVIPAYNCADSICRCLDSLFSQTYPHDRYSIIVVDDGSTDGTAHTIREHASRRGRTVTVLEQPNGGPASARNAGIAAAQEEIIAFIDADCVADADWLEHVVGALAASPTAAGVGGPIVNIMPPGWVSTYLHACAFYRHRVRDGCVEYLLTANVAFRRDALQRVGGFHVRTGVWGEDADLSFRLTQAGYVLLLARQGTVTHYGAPASLRGFMRELHRYGYGNAKLSRGWGQRRRGPAFELIRRGGAIALSAVLAVRYARRVGLRWAPAFLPLIIVEHATFAAGLLEGLMYAAGGRVRRGGQAGQDGRQGSGESNGPAARQRDYARAK